LAERYDIPLVEPAIRRDVARAGEAERAAGIGEVLEQELIGPARALDRHTQPLLELGGAAGVVNVAVSEPDLLDSHARMIARMLSSRQVDAREDHTGAFAFLFTQEGAVLLDRGDRNDGGAGLWHENLDDWRKLGRLERISRPRSAGRNR